MADYFEVTLGFRCMGVQFYNVLFYRAAGVATLPTEQQTLEIIANGVRDEIWRRSNPMESELQHLFHPATMLETISVRQYDAGGILQSHVPYTITVNEPGDGGGIVVNPSVAVYLSFNLSNDHDSFAPGVTAPKRGGVFISGISSDYVDMTNFTIRADRTQQFLDAAKYLAEPLNLTIGELVTFQPVRVKRSTIFNLLGWTAIRGVSLRSKSLSVLRSRNPVFDIDRD